MTRQAIDFFQSALTRSPLIDRLREHKAAVASVVAMSIKAVGALLMIAVFTLAARAMSANDFGQLAVWYNSVSLLAVAAVFGQDTLIARLWGEYSGRGEHAAARSAYRFGRRVTIVSAAVFVLGLLLVTPVIGVRIAPEALFAVAAFLFAQTFLHFSSHSSRVVVGFIVSELNREMMWRLVLLAVVAWAAVFHQLTMAQFFAAAVVGMIFSVLFQSLAVRRRLAEGPTEGGAADSPAWFASSRAMWISAVVEAVSQYADVMLIGYFASPAVAGEYFVAARIANIFLMVTTGLHTYSMSHSANLFFSNQIRKLQDILRSLATVSLAFLLPPVVVIVLGGKLILSIFGAHYAGVYPTLIVLALAAFGRSLCGPAPGILLTTGHERLYSWIVIVATAARMLLTAFLAAKYGALGAACGWAIGNLPLFVGLAIICRAVCGVDPSIAAIFTHWRSRTVART